MANTKVFLSDLKAGRCSSVVETRLLRFWEARNAKRGGELMWVDMLLIDVNSTMMQATINANRLPLFRSKLAAGSMFSISGFDVCRCAQNFKLTDSSLQIRFTESTVFDTLTEPVSPLPAEGFRFKNQTELVGLANTNTQLPDIMGEIIGVKSTVTDPPEANNRVMATLRMDSDDTVTLSLFDAQAIAFHKQLEEFRGDPKVIVATSINPKLIGGRQFLNATSGTHVYFDKETTVGEVLFYQLVARDTGIPSAAPLLRGHAKVEPLTIAELNNFVATASTQEIDFLCTGRVTSVDAEKGWCYVACTKCNKKLQRTGSAFTCARCDNTHAVGALRYRVEMTIADSTDGGTFVWFDGVMSKLHGLRANEAAQMLAEEGMNPEDSSLPPFIAEMEGKTYNFQVRVTSYNFTAQHKTFTITRIVNEVDGVSLPDENDDGDDDNDAKKSGKPTLGETHTRGGSGSGHVKTDWSASNVLKKPRIA